MNKPLFPIWLSVLFFTISFASYAQPQPEITLLPTIKAPLLLPTNGIAIAQFWVTNNGTRPSSWLVMPIKGVEQSTEGTNACANPITLKVGQSCLLNLKITGQELNKKLNFGPLLCKSVEKNNTKTQGKNCFQPPPEDSFNITLIKPEKAAISIEPPALALMQGNTSTTGVLTITNNSMSIIAFKIYAQLPKDWSDVHVDANDCKELKPQASCKIIITPGNAAHAPAVLLIAGSNTSQITSTVMIAAPEVKSLKIPS